MSTIQKKKRRRKVGMRIDVHAHYFNDEYLDLLVRFGSKGTDIARGLGAGATPKELQNRFKLMDDAGVKMQLLSVSPQLPYFENKAHAVEAARVANDLYAELVHRHPDRFFALAAVPLPHVEASLRELARALDDLGMLGVTIATTVLGRSIADPAFEPFYKELNKRGTVLYVHPAGVGADSPFISRYNLTWPIGAPIEDTIAVMHLIMRGIPMRYPKMRIINSHLGGALPMLLQRLDNQCKWAVPETPELPSLAVRRMWYDTATHAYIPALRVAIESLGPDRLLLGTDFPYQTGEFYKRSITYVNNAGLSKGDSSRIMDRNASTLLTLK